jgi:hypothetical protein
MPIKLQRPAVVTFEAFEDRKPETVKSSPESCELEQSLTPQETAAALRVSLSWLAKSRVRGDGPPYVKVGRMIRYRPSRVASWLKTRQRSSTSELRSKLMRLKIGISIPFLD